jgi:hypothetical protein
MKNVFFIDCHRSISGGVFVINLVNAESINHEDINSVLCSINDCRGSSLFRQ